MRCRSRGAARDQRYVEKLATPDVTIADIVGDIDPIKAAKGGLHLADELTMHFGLLPRANRGIFAINELPDLAGKIQVGLFNILQEGDVQIKGYPVRLPLDVLMVFSANPEDYTARGKIITPLKDRIGSEIRTHYPSSRAVAQAITAQEAWVARDGETRRRRRPLPRARLGPRDRRGDRVPGAGGFQDRQAERGQPAPADQRCWRTSCRTPSGGRCSREESLVVPRVTDVYAALPSITGKFELEYEGELRGAATVASDLIRAAVSNVATGYLDSGDFKSVVEWFDGGGSLQISDTTPAEVLLDETRRVPGLHGLVAKLGVDREAPQTVRASAIDFVLESLYAQKKISRSDDWRYGAGEAPRRSAGRTADTSFEQNVPMPGGGRKKYYN